MKNLKHVIVTTSFRGVFYGQIEESQVKDQQITLLNANNVIYWSSKTKGFLGLTNDGPNSDCRIGKMAGGPMQLHGITSITECSEKAIEAWKQYQN